MAGIGGRDIRTADLTDTLRAACSGTLPDGPDLDRTEAMSTKTTILTLPKEEYVHPGNRACTGCGLSIAYRIGLKALGPDTILVVPPSCLTVLQGLFPICSTKLPVLNVTFASTASSATGVIEALKAQGRDHIKVVGWAGDGGTADIGIQALSGAAERGDDFLFMCYDNEGYMNTGVQRSGTTPQWAITATTPVQGQAATEEGCARHHGRARHRLRGHGLGGLSAGPLRQDQARPSRSRAPSTYTSTRPARPAGASRPRYSIKLGRLAVETGYFDLYEVERGEFRLTGASEKLLEKRQLVPVAEYLKPQARFKVLD